MSRTIIAILGVVSLIVSPAVASAAYIPVTDLGIPSTHVSSNAFDFTQDGKVAVQGNTSGTVIGAYMWQNGTYTLVPNVPGTGTYNLPRGIDEDGTIVGQCRTSNTNTNSMMAYKWTAAGGTVALGTLGGTQSRADFINNGDIIGSSQITGNSVWNAYIIYSGTSTMVNIGALASGQNSYIYKINDSRHVIGLSYNSSGVQRGCFYDGTWNSIEPLAGYSYTMAYGMNNNDVVVGYSNKSGDQQAIYWTKSGGSVGLGYLDSTQLNSAAIEVNNLGQIVGQANIKVGANVETHAVMWNNGVITDLNTLIDPASGWLLQYTKMIDDKGTITGWGTRTIDGVTTTRGFIMTVPEPSTLALLAAGLVGLLAYAWRKRR